MKFKFEYLLLFFIFIVNFCYSQVSNLSNNTKISGSTSACAYEAYTLTLDGLQLGVQYQLLTTVNGAVLDAFQANNTRRTVSVDLLKYNEGLLAFTLNSTLPSAFSGSPNTAIAFPSISGLALSYDGALNEGEYALDNMLSKQVQGVSTNSVRFGSKWDPVYLYIGARVLDSDLITTPAGSNDYVILYLNPYTNTPSGTFFNPSTSATGPSFGLRVYNATIGVSSETACIVEPSYPGRTFSGITSRSRFITGGYEIEFRIPWNAFGAGHYSQFIQSYTNAGFSFDIGKRDFTTSGSNASLISWNSANANNGFENNAYGKLLFNTDGRSRNSTSLNITNFKPSSIITIQDQAFQLRCEGQIQFSANLGNNIPGTNFYWTLSDTSKSTTSLVDLNRPYDLKLKEGQDVYVYIRSRSTNNTSCWNRPQDAARSGPYTIVPKPPKPEKLRGVLSACDRTTLSPVENINSLRYFDLNGNEYELRQYWQKGGTSGDVSTEEPAVGSSRSKVVTASGDYFIQTRYEVEGLENCWSERSPLATVKISPLPPSPEVVRTVTKDVCGELEVKYAIQNFDTKYLYYYSVTTALGVGPESLRGAPELSQVFNTSSKYYVSLSAIENGQVCRSNPYIDSSLVDVGVVSITTQTPFVTAVELEQFAQPQMLSAQATEGASLLWWESVTDTIPSSNPILVTTDNYGEFLYYVSQQIGKCQSPKAELKVIINQAVPPLKNFDYAITPNGDGKNEILLIKDLEFYPNNTLKIYDRWGNQIFSQVNYNNVSGPKFDGSALPEGVYFYHLNVGNKDKNVSGTVNIYR